MHSGRHLKIASSRAGRLETFPAAQAAPSYLALGPLAEKVWAMGRRRPAEGPRIWPKPENVITARDSANRFRTRSICPNLSISAIISKPDSLLLPNEVSETKSADTSELADQIKTLSDDSVRGCSGDSVRARYYPLGEAHHHPHDGCPVKFPIDLDD